MNKSVKAFLVMACGVSSLSVIDPVSAMPTGDDETCLSWPDARYGADTQQCMSGGDEPDETNGEPSDDVVNSSGKTKE